MPQRSSRLVAAIVLRGARGTGETETEQGRTVKARLNGSGLSAMLRGSITSMPISERGRQILLLGIAAVGYAYLARASCP